jgi:hypothetical protein
MSAEVKGRCQANECPALATVDLIWPVKGAVEPGRIALCKEHALTASGAWPIGPDPALAVPGVTSR